MTVLDTVPETRFEAATLARAVSTTGPLTFTASTPDVARDGLALRASGWRLENYAKSPVVQWAHRHDERPIGRGRAWVESGRLMIDITFDTASVDGAEVDRQYREGFLHAVSVGWNFVDAQGRKVEWWRLTPEQIATEVFYDLLEVSAVPVPADPNALIERQRAGLRDLGRQLTAIAGPPSVSVPGIDAATAQRILGALDTPTVPAGAARQLLAAFGPKGQ